MIPTERNIKTPELMWQHFLDYIKWTEANPRKKDLATKDTKSTKGELTLQRCLSWSGFHMYVATHNIAVHLKNYRHNTSNRYNDFIDIMDVINSCIKEDQTSGSMAGIYNSNIASKLLGLIDQQEIKADVGITEIKIIRPKKRDTDNEDDKNYV